MSIKRNSQIIIKIMVSLDQIQNNTKKKNQQVPYSAATFTLENYIKVCKILLNNLKYVGSTGGKLKKNFNE